KPASVPGTRPSQRRHTRLSPGRPESARGTLAGPRTPALRWGAARTAVPWASSRLASGLVHPASIAIIRDTIPARMCPLAIPSAMVWPRAYPHPAQRGSMVGRTRDYAPRAPPRARFVVGDRSAATRFALMPARQFDDRNRSDGADADAPGPNSGRRRLAD